ncbi:MAG: RNA polymerase sigma-54 factor, partial [bacterium]
LKKIIQDEDKHKPLSDDILVVELAKDGYTLARRTVAKYRDQMNYPVARLRKQI